ncbi:thioredoxin domain-containing protein [Desulfobulbus rhabdoformis]|uniref:vitamin K epoxide reductase/DsbA family protein n=1 Tax=Desulfobulbus rhabdoformis TaxID=34032 RepID=UPI0019635E71|nr:vitamin K epoxide reductase family protein [Desulfobulbus rhabdoformis]MBM9614420.1 thioredoxin domain-containing protein [Desulfobulbus rhabdoformis]
MARLLTHTSDHLPYRFYTIPVLILILLGVIDTGYLAWLHYQNYTNLSFSSFCALSKSINCDTVAQSPWSIFWGLPLALWGLGGYTLFLILFSAIFRDDAAQKKTVWYLFFLLALFFSGISLYLGYISATLIRAHCILCMVSYALNFSLLLYSWLIIRRFCEPASPQGIVSAIRSISQSPARRGGLLCICGAFILARLIIPPYWLYTPPTTTSQLTHGVTEQGHPWIGAEHPQLTIHEYTDYQCFQCSKVHLFLRQLIMEHPKTIRLVHHHYPMDHAFNNVIVPEPFHVGSGKMAMIGIFAASRDKFWKMNDALYTMGRKKEAFNTRTLAEMTGMHAGELAAATRSEFIRNILLYDIREGMKLEIIGTPTFVINGKVYPGAIPAEILHPYLH